MLAVGYDLLHAEVTVLRLPESPVGGGNQWLRRVERFGNDDLIVGLRLEFPSGDEMLRIGLNRYIADMALPDYLCRAGILGKRRGRGFPSCSDPGPVTQRRERHRELPADFSNGDVRYTVALRDLVTASAQTSS